MVHVLYYRMVRQLPADIYQSYFQQLPPFIQRKLIGFRHWEDAERTLSGNILLMKALETVGIPAESIAQLKYTEFQKPYLDAPVSFNITHSGEYIVCAISKTVKVGIDVEEIKEIPLIDFTQFFYQEEWQAVLDSVDSLHAFYTLWTKKEAFLKVIGSGLSVPVNQVVISDNIIKWEDEEWYLQEISLENKYVSWLCTDHPSAPVNIIEVKL